MMATLSPSSQGAEDPAALSPTPLDPEDNIVLKPINVAENNDKMSAHPRFWCGQHSAAGENTKDVYNYAIPVSDKSKTPMCQIAELARFHKLKHEYQLMDESGPAHKKLFTVQLVLTAAQIFSGSGASIKKAQQSAAAEALRLTTLSKPPERNMKRQKRNGDPSSPCVLLSHVCRRLKMVEPVYTINSFYPPKGMVLQQQQFPFPAAAPPVPPAMMAHYPPLTPKSIVSPGTSSLLSSSSPRSPSTPGTSCPSASSCGLPLPLVASPQQPAPMVDPLGMCYLLPGGGLRPNRNTLPNLHAPTHMCTIVMASHPPVHAIADTKQEARHQAATQALCLLGPALAMLEQKMKEEKRKEDKGAEVDKENIVAPAAAGDSERDSCEADGLPSIHNAIARETDEGGDEEEEEREEVEVGREQECDESARPRGGRKSKSVISQVHECALQMKLTVEFEVVSEEGKAHDRSYAVECRLLGGETVLEARGYGRQKREAKQSACAELMETLKKMESSPVHIATVLYKSQKKALAAQPREPKRKTIVKHMKMDPSYGHQINPVSRLIQVLQARGEPDPQFEFLGEAGQYKYKQFNVQVIVGDLFAEGAGPNKRLAKRAAAECMLETMGVAKRLPEPGKSLLKRRDDDPSCGGGGGAMMSIGVFNPDELDAPPPPPPPPPEPREEKKRRRERRVIAWAEEEARDQQVQQEEGEGEDGEEEEGRKEPRRRVTFNAQVAACTAPDHVSYPMTEVAPLKVDDLGCAGKARRRGREGRVRSLTDAQKLELGRAALAWVDGTEKPEEDNVFRIETVMAPPEKTTAKTRLEKLGSAFGFNAHYTIFPQGESANAISPSSSPAPSSSSSSASSMAVTSSRDSPMTSGAAYFVIVNIPLSKAIMGEGHGATMDDAHEAAAADALGKIAADPAYVPAAAAAVAHMKLQQQRPEQPMQQPMTSPPIGGPAHPRSLQQRPPPQQQQPNPYYGYGGMLTGGAPQQHMPPRPSHPLPSLQDHSYQFGRNMTMYNPQPPQQQHFAAPAAGTAAAATASDYYGQYDGPLGYGSSGMGRGGAPPPNHQRPNNHNSQNSRYQYSNGV